MAYGNGAVDDFIASIQHKDLIEIYIGPKDEENPPLFVLKDILCRRSKYFRQALNGPFREGQHGVLNFPEDTKEPWGLLLYYLHCGQMPKNGYQSHESYLLSLANAYILGDKYGLAAFQNQIIHLHLELFEDAVIGSDISVECLLRVMQLLPSECHLRTLILQQIVSNVMHCGRPKWTDLAELAACPKTFGVLMEAMEGWAVADWDHDSVNARVFPLHQYGKDKEETANFLLKEEEEAVTSNM